MFQNVGDVDGYKADVQRQESNADPNDLMYSLDASRDYDPKPALGQIKARVFALNFEDDEFNPDRLGILQRTMKRVKAGSYVVTKGTPETFGHLTMAHPQLWSRYVGAFMSTLDR